MNCVARPRADIVTCDVIALNAIPESWDAAWRTLMSRVSEPTAFGEAWFLRPSIAHLRPPAGARIIGVWRGPELLGLLPVFTALNYGRMRVSHVENWLHYHAFLGTPPVRSGCEAQFWTAVLAALDTADWAPSFLHLNGLVADGPVLAALQSVRRADVVHRAERALLASTLAPNAYYEAHVRKKKRKELGRLQARLRECGTIACDRLASDHTVGDWIDAFLTLEASGWKGRAGTALRDDRATLAFFRGVVTGAFAAGKLEMLRLTLDGRPIAMLVNFLTPPGSFSFKIAFDEDYARFSPGVLVQLENLAILDRQDIAWMDSCAVEGHAMINSLWAERRAIVRVTVPLRGWRRRTVFAVARTLENAAAAVRKLS